MKRLSFGLIGLALLASTWGAPQARGQHGDGAGRAGGAGGGVTRVMGRIRTMGFEIGAVSGLGELEGSNGGQNLVMDTTVFRSGAQSLKCDTGALNQISFQRLNIDFTTEMPALGQTSFYRAYFRFTSFPTTDNTVIFRLYNTATVTNVISARLGSNHALRLFQDVAGTQIGGDSAVLQTGVWYRIELSCLINTGSVDTAELRLDGISVASGSGLTLSESQVQVCDIGYLDPAAPGANAVLNIDDLAINTSVGTTQNSWCGDGKIVLLKPTSDNLRGTWTGGAGGTTNLWDAVNNLPPAGVAAASETNTSQIKNLTSSATDNCDLNTTDYLTAGIAAADTVTVVQGVCVYGDAGTLSLRNGALKIVSNPAQSVEDTFDYNAAALAIGTYPLQWRAKWGTAQVSPTLTLGTAPVLRVGKRTATTREVDVCFMGIYVEYVPAVAVATRRWLPLLCAGK